MARDIARPQGARPDKNYNRQLSTLMILAILLPAVLIMLMGAYATYLLPRTILFNGFDSRMATWGITLLAAVLAATGVASSLQRMRSTYRKRAVSLAEVFEQMTSGNRQARAEQGGNDEFAMLALAANRLLSNGVSAVNRDLGATTDVAQLQAQIERLMQDVSLLSEGDLRVKAEVTPDALGVLADSFNYMAEELGKVVGKVQATALQVTNATRRLLARSAEVSHASQAGAVQVRQAFDLVAQLAEFVQLSAQNSLTTVESAREALNSAQGGQQAVVQSISAIGHIRDNVQETSKKIKRLGERAQEVGEIVRIIEEIAEQTNLLALNAAIQTSMQGENGRGFTDADEIRSLAERAAAASKRVGIIVRTIQSDTQDAIVAMEQSTQDVVQGSRLADETGRALQSIFISVEKQSQLSETIARAASDRTRNAADVAAAMRQIADIARLTNEAVQETTDGITYLADLSEQLRASVAAFRLPEQIAEQEGLIPATGTRWQGQPGAALTDPATGGPFGGYSLPTGSDVWGGTTGQMQPPYVDQQYPTPPIGAERSTPWPQHELP
ncbi:MAG TPA: methyl-accepting chemotaxis protein [Ktedonobacterales bacterium]